MFFVVLMYSRRTLKIASSFLSFLDLINLSTSDLNSISCLATIVFSTVMGMAQFWFDPTARNSNLLPVNANGEVRFLSVLSNNTSGIFPTTLSFKSVFSCGDSFPLETCSKLSNTVESCEPIKTEIMAGGASFAPSRWSFPALATDERTSAS